GDRTESGLEQENCEIRTRRRPRPAHADQEKGRTEGIISTLARATSERSLCATFEGRGLSVPGCLQADRDRRQAPSAEAGHEGDRSRSGAGWLVPGCGAENQIDSGQLP